MEQYGARLAAVCALMLGDRDLAQDIVQETFIRATKDWSAFAVNVRERAGMADQHCGQSLQKRTEKELVSLY
ncbi:MAG: RNA polymerase sigma factor [Christensenellales bacterium]